jgi:predicted nucleic acid-binding protein
MLSLSVIWRKFNRPNTYDAHYLALAENLNCPFWTGDERLFNAVHSDFSDVFWLGAIKPGS